MPGRRHWPAPGQLDGDRNFEIDTGHDLMITEPKAIADMLLQVA
jgi:hypothetical protein